MNPIYSVYSSGRATVLALAVAAPLLVTAQSAAPLPAGAARYLRTHATTLGLSDADLADITVTNSYTDAHNGVTHVYLRQQLDGQDLLGTEVGLHFTAAGALLTRTGTFVAQARQQAARAATPALTSSQATAAATRHLRLVNARNAQSPSAVFVRQPDGALRRAWRVELRPATGPDAWTVLVDAATGQILKAANRVRREPVKYPASTPGAAVFPPQNRQLGPAAPNSYRVFGSPLESPLHGAATVAANPADAVASPYGWHDTNGAAGPEFTTARGNNAHAFVPTGSGAPGFSPDGGSLLEFDFPFDPALSPQGNQAAALTNVFYWTNLLHDLSLRYGFTEASGNFQATNYTGLGRGSDYIRVKIEDEYSQAYFVPTADGVNPSQPNDVPEIVLGIWARPLNNAVTISAPAAAAGSYAAMPIGLGPSLPTATPLTGQLVLVDDGTTTPSWGCNSPLLNAAQVQGRIAVIDFTYECDVEAQVRNAQNAGATAVVLVNSLDFVFSMGYNTSSITIPAVMIARTEGRRIKAALRAGSVVTASLRGGAPAADRNGGFDNGILAHEYAHGITTRLTGGAALAPTCLDNAEQMGEGWSDFFELWTTTRPGDVAATPRGLGAYVLGQPVTGPGIRPMPYTTDFAVNNSTYAFIGQTVDEVNYGNDSSGYPEDVHATGFVWCSVLWDLNWAMIQRYGYDANLATGTGGNNKTMQLVMDGLKLQPCSPGFLDGRDALLAADRAAFNGANQALIWQVFARRGMGTNAVQGSSDELTDNTAGFQVPGALATAGSAPDPSALEVYPNPARGRFMVRYAPARSPMQLALTSVLGQTVRTRILSTTEAAAGFSLDTQSLAPGLYLVRLTTPTGTLTRRLVVQP